MADTLGMADLRGLDVDKLAKGYADQMFVFKKYLNVSPTSAREIRWYRKTSGVLDSTDTTGITTSQIVATAFGALPPIAEQSATQLTSYIKHFAIESPWFTYADIRDSDLDMLAINIRDLTRAVQNQIDYRIFDVLSGGIALSGSAAADWDTIATANPFQDLVSGSTNIENYNYDVSGLVVLMHPNQKKALLDWLVSQKGSYIPTWSSQMAQTASLMQLAGQSIVVSPNVTQKMVIQLVPQRCATWKQFTPITAITKEEPGIGVKVRVWEDGEIIITDPYAANIIKGC